MKNERGGITKSPNNQKIDFLVNFYVFHNPGGRHLSVYAKAFSIGNFFVNFIENCVNKIIARTCFTFEFSDWPLSGSDTRRGLIDKNNNRRAFYRGALRVKRNCSSCEGREGGVDRHHKSRKLLVKAVIRWEKKVLLGWSIKNGRFFFVWNRKYWKTGRYWRNACWLRSFHFPTVVSR